MTPRPPARLFVTVKAAVWRGERLLLLREDPGDGAHVHDLPGGRLEPGEAVEAGLRRELREELGVEVAEVGALPVKVWTAVTSEGVGVVGLLYEVRLASEAFDLRGEEEVVAAEYLTQGEQLATREFVHKRAIAEYYRERLGG